MIAIALTILAAALINRFRGGGVVPPELFDPPGHRRLWSTPLMAGLAALHLDWHAALAFAACWLLWAALPWGRWYTLGRGERDWSGAPDWFERMIEAWSRSLLIGFLRPAQFFQPAGRIIADHSCLFLRNAIVLAPLAAFVSLPAAIIVLVGMSIAYELSWRLISEARGPTGWAEWVTGALWGVALLAWGAL